MLIFRAWATCGLIDYISLTASLSQDRTKESAVSYFFFSGLRPQFSRVNSPLAFLGFACSNYNFAKKNKRLLAVYFGLKTGIHLAHFGLELGMVFGGTTGVYERIYRFNSK